MESEVSRALAGKSYREDSGFIPSVGSDTI